MEEIFFRLYDNKGSVIVLFVICIIVYIAGIVLEDSYND